MQDMTALTVTHADYPTLRRARLFAGMDDTALGEALSLLEARVGIYEKNELVHRMGEPFGAFGLLLGGDVAVYTDDLDGCRMMMASVARGATFGEAHAYLATEAPPVYVQAGAGGARILWLAAAPLRTAADDPSPARRALVARFTAMLAAHTLLMNSRIQILSKRTLREKIMTFLLNESRAAGARTFTVPFDREGLAAYLAVNRSALSRELSAMQEEGIIRYYRSSFKIL